MTPMILGAHRRFHRAGRILPWDWWFGGAHQSPGRRPV